MPNVDFFSQFYMEKLKVKDSRGEYHLCADLKVNNASVGVMAHGARCPCYCCTWVKGDAEDEAPRRTFEGIMAKNLEWVADGADPNKLKDYANCRSAPLDLFPIFGYVLLWVPPSSLHLKQGLVNHAYAAMKAVYPGCTWAAELAIKTSYYHGGWCNAWTWPCFDKVTFCPRHCLFIFSY